MTRATEAPGAVLGRQHGCWFIAHLGALLAAMALSHSSYRPPVRHALLRVIYRRIATGLPVVHGAAVVDGRHRA